MRYSRTAAIIAAACCGAPCAAQLRVLQWNITNYTSGRAAEFQAALFASFNGRSASPDVIVAEEIVNAAGAANFVNLLNSAPGGFNDWVLAPFVLNGGDTSNALFFRSSKATYLGVVTLNQGTGNGAGQPPRDNQRWRVRLSGYSSAGAELYLYAAHMKAGSGASDRDRRTPECQRLRDNAETLPAGAHFLLGGDFNMQTWNEVGYQIMISPTPSLAGRFIDPIKSPGYVMPSPTGSWNSNNAYRFIHTQDPATCDASCSDTDCNGGGMDDRHDQVLISGTLADGNGLDYMGNTAIPYSTTTWNDLNHSYRAWGNDGTSLNCRLRISGNAMVGPVIAEALVTSADGQGHLPILLDLQVPAKVISEAALDFGTVEVGQPATRVLTVSNGVSLTQWSRAGNGTGIDDLDYSLAASPRFSAPGGNFAALAGVPGNMHVISMNTSTPGPVSGTVTILSDDPDQPSRVVTLTGMVNEPPPSCACDWNGDTFLNSQDFFDFLGAFFDVNADFNKDGFTNSQDLFDFLTCFFAGC